MTSILTKLASFTVLSGIALGSWYVTKIAKSGNPDPATVSKNLASKEALDETLACAQKLLTALKENNWDRSKVDTSLFRAPAQAFDEDPHQRTLEYPTFMTGGPKYPNREEVAFFTDLFVRRNVRKGKGPEGVVASPEGSFIVAWKNGEITVVSIEDVRLYPTPDAVDTFSYVFPGTKVYKSTLPKMGGVK